MDANIVEIKRFAVHDGDGIRTTVFFKGCPLRCLWCHNPETLSAERQLAFYRHKCTLCGKCGEVCSCHSFAEGVHSVNRAKCVGCGKCVAACPQSALALFGETRSVDSICAELLKDKCFYDESNGGITLSGGECLLQSEACREILAEMKRNGVNTAVDTCGFVPQEAFDRVLPFTDTFLYDVKAIDEAVHVQCTGRSNQIILENLRYIDDCGARIEIRVPYVPDYNDTQIEKIAEFLSTLKHLVRVRVLPYHNYAASKYDALSLKNTLPMRLPTDEEIAKARAIFTSVGIRC